MDIISPDKLQALANQSAARYRSETDMARMNKRIREDLLDDLHEAIRQIAPEGSANKHDKDKEPTLYDLAKGMEMAVRMALVQINCRGGMDPMKRKAIRFNEKGQAND